MMQLIDNRSIQQRFECSLILGPSNAAKQTGIVPPKTK